MLYASSKQALRTPLGGGVNKDVQASTFDDISKDEGALLPFFLTLSSVQELVLFLWFTVEKLCKR